MFVRVLSFALDGIEAIPIQVEVDISNGIPCFEIVGLPDAAVRESRERVRAALRNGGWNFPAQRITVNLAPAYTRKGGAGFDLAIALGVLAASGQLNPSHLDEVAACAELALNGSLRPVRGVLAMALAAPLSFIVAEENAREAAQAGGRVYGARHLSAVMAHLSGVEPLPGAEPLKGAELQTRVEDPPDLAEVRGQVVARRALEIAAAGGHNLLLMGPPGAGKSLLARCLPGILPILDREEALEISRIYSVAGLLAGGRLLRHRPFRSPHHSASRAALLGGGTPLRPGEITLAHRGVLFLDELPEFRRDVLEGLRQPLEEGRIQLSRVHGNLSLPARPMLVGAANPCPCGYLGDSKRPCTCHPAAVALYRSRLSGPVIDRFDLQIWLAPVPYSDLLGDRVPMESSAAVQARVAAARSRQLHRLRPEGISCNAEMSRHEIRHHCQLPPGGEDLMQRAVEQFGLSMRGHDRVLKVARTIADLAGAVSIEVPHLAEALQYRGADRAMQSA